MPHKVLRTLLPDPLLLNLSPIRQGQDLVDLPDKEPEDEPRVRVSLGFRLPGDPDLLPVRQSAVVQAWVPIINAELQAKRVEQGVRHLSLHLSLSAGETLHNFRCFEADALHAGGILNQ